MGGLAQYIHCFALRAQMDILQGTRSQVIFRTQEQPEYRKHRELINKQTAASYMLIIPQKPFEIIMQPSPQLDPAWKGFHLFCSFKHFPQVKTL